jgi:hypothetical protein
MICNRAKSISAVIAVLLVASALTAMVALPARAVSGTVAFVQGASSFNGVGQTPSTTEAVTTCSLSSMVNAYDTLFSDSASTQANNVASFSTGLGLNTYGSSTTTITNPLYTRVDVPLTTNSYNELSTVVEGSGSVSGDTVTWPSGGTGGTAGSNIVVCSEFTAGQLVNDNIGRISGVVSTGTSTTVAVALSTAITPPTGDFVILRGIAVGCGGVSVTLPSGFYTAAASSGVNSGVTTGCNSGSNDWFTMIFEAYDLSWSGGSSTLSVTVTSTYAPTATEAYDYTTAQAYYSIPIQTTTSKTTTTTTTPTTTTTATTTTTPTTTTTATTTTTTKPTTTTTSTTLTQIQTINQTLTTTETENFTTTEIESYTVTRTSSYTTTATLNQTLTTTETLPTTITEVENYTTTATGATTRTITSVHPVIVTVAQQTTTTAPLPYEPEGVRYIPVGAVLYLWYGYNNNTGTWTGGNGTSHWNDSPLGKAVDKPSIGWYASDNNATLAWQLANMQKAGISVIVVSWWGVGNESGGSATLDRAINNATLNLFRYVESTKNLWNFKIAVMVEPFNSTDLTSADYTSLYNYVENTFYKPFNDITFYWQSKPLILSFNPNRLPSLPALSMFTYKEEGNSAGVDWAFWEGGYYNDSSWGTENAANYEHSPYISPGDKEVGILPRYDDYYLSDAYLATLHETGGRTGYMRFDYNYSQGMYNWEWNYVIGHRTQLNFVLLYSWNEYHERSEIEPHFDHSLNTTVNLVGSTGYAVKVLESTPDTGPSSGPTTVAGLAWYVAGIIVVLAIILAIFAFMRRYK